MNLPTHDFLSAPLWLFTALHLLTLSLHFVAMNFVLGGVIAMLWGKFGDRWSHPVVRLFVKAFPTAMAATVSLGVAPLLFTQVVYGQVFYSASVVSAWFWLSVVGIAIIAYYAFYGAALTEAGGRRQQQLLFVAFVCLIVISIIYSSVFAMGEHPEALAELYAARPDGLVINPHLGDWGLRWLHMLFGAVTVGGFFVGAVGRDDREAFKVGKRFFLFGMIAASGVGIGALATLGDDLRPFMKSPGIWALTVAVLLSLGSLHLYFKKRVVPSGLLLFVSLLGMVFARHHLRLVRLAESFDPATLRVAPQWDLVAIFGLCFLAMLGLLAWMVRLYLREAPEA